jgi:predicted DNA-binding protein
VLSLKTFMLLFMSDTQVNKENKVNTVGFRPSPDLRIQLDVAEQKLGRSKASIVVAAVRYTFEKLTLEELNDYIIDSRAKGGSDGN